MAVDDGDDEDTAATVAIGEFRVFPGRPLPGLRVGTATAYHAESLEWPLNEYYAVICDPVAMPRLDIISSVRKVEAAGLVTPLDWRVLDWPPSGRRHLVIVYLKPRGGRLVDNLGDATGPIPEDDVVRSYMVPLVSALATLHAAGIAHGGINPTAIVFRDFEREQPMLGECVSAAVALRQPASFLTIETAMISPPSRNTGQRGDDIFALGMTLVHLQLGGSLAAGKTDAEVLAARMERSSFAALVGENRLSTGMNEMLRGLLADEPKMRWTIGELEAWLPSRRMPVRQGSNVRRALRPFEFQGKVFATGAALAHAFATAVPEAATAIRSKDFETWIKRALNDEHSARLLKLAQGEGAVGVPNDRRDECLVARTCMSLDTTGPMRYRGIAVTVDGYGGALAAAFLGNGSIQPLAEMLTLSLPQFWLAARQPVAPEHISMHKNFDQLRSHLNDRRFGFGIERVLYELNPTLHCLSPLLEEDHVLNLPELLAGLERRAAQDFGGISPLDRHAAGFIAARTKGGGVHQWADALSSADPSQRALGTLRALAPIQLNAVRAPLPGVAKWAAAQAPVLIDAFHHRPTRRRLAAEVEDAAHAGRLTELLITLDDPDGKAADAAAFAEAVAAHAHVAAELRKGANDGPRRERQALELAGQLAAGFSSTLSVAAMLAAALVLS
jgi:hypothetical protein